MAKNALGSFESFRQVLYNGGYNVYVPQITTTSYFVENPGIKCLKDQNM